MAKLYPPILESSIPAFYGTGTITVPFSLNRTVGYGDITGFAIIVKSTVTNDIIYTDTTNTITSGYAKFSIPSSSLEQGGFYKVQLAFIDSSNTTGYYSNVSIVKYIGTEAPVLAIQDETATEDCFIGTYTCADITEKMYSYTFTLYDNDGNELDTSGECLHNSSEDVGTTQQDSWRPTVVLDNGNDYMVKFAVTTINGLEVAASEGITTKKDEEGYCPDSIRLNAALNEENAYVEITISSAIQNDYRNLMYGTFYIYKTSSKDNFESKYKVAYFSLDNQDLYEQTFKDFTVESGYQYQYILQQVNDYGIYSEEVYSNKVWVYYDHMYLFDGIKQLKIEFDPKVSSFKDTILETKQDTIGGKYPFIFRNKNVQYKEMSLSGLISYQMDEENLFANDYEIWSTVEQSLDGTYASDKSGWTHNLTDNSVTAERAFKLMVLDWLNDGTAKLFKSPVEGNYIIRLLSVSLSPQDSLGRMLHTFTATAYEVDAVENVDFCEAIQVDNSGKYIGYRTIPLYNFPETKIVGLADNGKYYAIDNNTIYEIIGTSALEYVRGVRFEDVKPGTKFKLVLERGLEKSTITIRIGATGFYRLPRDLGYHIKSIKLVAENWNTGDTEFDIINNRGQVTYEYERMAKHNNFNDITAIQSGICVASPWYPSWYNVALQEPIVDLDGKALYTYDSTGVTTAFVEMGYFYKINSNGTKVTVKSNIADQGYLLINGIDYIVEDDVYTYKDSSSTTIYPYTSDEIANGITNCAACAYYEEGDSLYTYEKAQTLISTASGTAANYITDWEWQDQTLAGGVTKATVTESSWKEGTYYYYDTNNKTYVLSTSYVSGTTYYTLDTYYYQDYSNSTDIFNATFTVSNKTYDTFSEYTNSKWTIGMPIDSSKITSTSTVNYNANVQYKSLGLDDSNSVILFIQSTNSQGNNIIQETVEDEKFYRNPFYVTLNYISDTSTQQVEATVSTISAVLTSSSLGSTNTDVSNSTDTIFKNFVPDKYYNQTNVNGDYYIKEEMMNIYDMDFELIQVFYPENLLNKQNFEYTDGTVVYTDVEEDAGYQYTERRISGVGLNAASEAYLRYAEANLASASDWKADTYYYYDNGAYKLSTSYVSDTTYYTFDFDSYSDIVLIGDEMYGDQMLLGETKTEQDFILEYPIVLANSAYIEDNWSVFQSLYDIPDDIDYATYYDSYYLNLPLYYFTNSSVVENGYFYKLIEQRYVEDSSANDSYSPSDDGTYFKNSSNNYEQIEIKNVYVNIRAQAAKKYTEATTPNDNEIIFVYDDSPYHIERVDLSDRFSYSISAAALDQEDLRNITGVYLGRNVRGFATYKRKLYNYHALIADGVYMDLEAFTTA